MENKHSLQLSRGGKLLFDRGADRRAGEVISTGPSRVVIQFSRPLWENVEVGQTVGLHYWHDRKTRLLYQAEILRMGAERRQIEVAIREERVERREHRRFEVPVGVTARILEAVEPSLAGREFVAETRNISLGGLLLETGLCLGVGDRLEVDLRLGPSERLRAEGWVVRSRQIRRKEYVGTVVMKIDYALAVEFQLGEAARRQLLRFLLGEGARASAGRSPTVEDESSREASPQAS